MSEKEIIAVSKIGHPELVVVRAKDKFFSLTCPKCEGCFGFDTKDMSNGTIFEGCIYCEDPSVSFLLLK